MSYKKRKVPVGTLGHCPCICYKDVSRAKIFDYVTKVFAPYVVTRRSDYNHLKSQQMLNVHAFN